MLSSPQSVLSADIKTAIHHHFYFVYIQETICGVTAESDTVLNGTMLIETITRIITYIENKFTQQVFTFSDFS